MTRLLPSPIAVLFVALLAGLVACAGSTQKPGAPYHHTTSGFRNPPGSPERGSFWQRAPWLLTTPFRLSGRGDVVVPDDHVVPPAEALAAFEAAGGQDTITWIGHMTALLRIDDAVVLTDPWFTDYATPVPPLGPKRVVPPGLAIADLPPIDMVVISHSHYDHLDLPTIEMLPNKERITAVVPLKLGRYFRERGYERVIELDWYEATEAAGLTFTALPVIHWSKRSLFRTNDTLWASFAIETQNGLRVYFGGDAEYGPVYGEVNERAGGFDVALISIGAFLPRAVMNGAHCVPDPCMQLALDLNAHTLVGMHWGTVRLGDDGFLEPAERFRAAGRKRGLPDERVWLMRIGETRVLPRRPAVATQ